MHVWAPDLTIDDVKKRSTLLMVNEAAHFRQMSFSILQGLNSNQITMKLTGLLDDWTTDEKFTKDYEAKSAPLIPTTYRKHEQPGILAYSQESGFNFHNVAAKSCDGHTSHQIKEQSKQNLRKVSSYKHKNTINTLMSPATLLSNMKYRHIFKLSDIFQERSASDGSIKGVGNDIRLLSSLFGLSRDDVAQLSLAHMRGQRPMELLIRTLSMRKPDLTVEELEEKFITIKRFDAVEYIRDNVYSY